MRANIDDAERTEESAEDITAAETAPSPKNDTKLKQMFQRCWNIPGNQWRPTLGSSIEEPLAVSSLCHPSG